MVAHVFDHRVLYRSANGVMVFRMREIVIWCDRPAVGTDGLRGTGRLLHPRGQRLARLDFDNPCAKDEVAGMGVTVRREAIDAACGCLGRRQGKRHPAVGATTPVAL